MKNLILLIPGNPSVPGIYDPFLNNLVSELSLHGETKSLVLPHLGQCNERTVKRKKIRVQDVIEDHRKKIAGLISTFKPERTILIGHSLGSAVTIDLYRDFESSVDQFLILCPFLGPSKNNVGYLKMFRHPITRLGMKSITYSTLKSQRVSREVFKRWLGENPFNDHIPNEIRKPRYLKNFFSLVANYIEDFEELNLKSRFRQMSPDKVSFYFAPKDYWVPREIVDLIPNHLPKYTCQGIQHDFCLSEQQYSLLCREIAINFTD